MEKCEGMLNEHAPFPRCQDCKPIRSLHVTVLCNHVDRAELCMHCQSHGGTPMRQAGQPGHTHERYSMALRTQQSCALTATTLPLTYDYITQHHRYATSITTHV